MELVKNVIKDIRNKNFLPVYFLMGEETYYIDKVTESLLENVLSEDEKSFNLDILYGKDTDANQIMSIARQFPLMSDYRLVVVKEAQEIKDIETLAVYLNQIQPQTILVVNYKYKVIDKRKSLHKQLTKSDAFLLDSVKTKDHQVPAFLKNIVQSKKRTIEAKATSMLVDFLGNNLTKIENEITKLCILVPEGEEITDVIIETNIGISKDYNNFEFIKAIASKDRLMAYRIAQYFVDNPKNNPPVVTVSLLYNFFSTLLQYHGVIHKNKSYTVNDVAKVLNKNSFQLKDSEIASQHYSMKETSRNINYLKDFDLKLKGVNSTSANYQELIIEFLSKIFI